VIAEGEYGYPKVNVEQQRHDPESLLNWLERMLRRRKECPALGFGDCSFIDLGLPQVLAHRCDHAGTAVLAVHNFSARRVKLRLPVQEGGGEDACVHDILAGRREVLRPDGHHEVELGPYGYRWYRLETGGSPGALC
jgi:maltose alpha-D-glucosyltransferase / alpha-amylase